MEDKLILKNNLKQARAEKGLSQSELAALVGVSRNTISSIETGQFNPTAKLALILCIALDKKFEELFFFRGKRLEIRGRLASFAIYNKNKENLIGKFVYYLYCNAKYRVVKYNHRKTADIRGGER